MRALTFKGFLARYVKELSRENTLDIRLLAADAAAGGYRLRAPLVLYAVVSGKSTRLAEALGEFDDSPALREMLAFLTAENVEELLRNDELPEEYQKVWNAYQVALKTPERDEALKDAIRKKVLAVQAKNHCTNYRIYTDLKLNPGNVNAWLKNGNGDKVSYRTAERIMEFVMRYEKNTCANWIGEKNLAVALGVNDFTDDFFANGREAEINTVRDQY